MKKHASLFLALLMVFSFLFATSVEAAQLKQDKTEKMYHNTNEVIARANASVEPPSDGIHGVSNDDPIPGGGGCTAHVFRSQYLNSGYHRLICVNCGYTKTASHAFGSPVKCSEEQHKQKCTVCGYTKKTNHTFGDPVKYTSTKHKASCVACGYTETENHSFCNPVMLTETQHIQTCSCCGYSKRENHIYTCEPLLGDDRFFRIEHKATCVCGYTTTARHTFEESVYYGFKYCPDCDTNIVDIGIASNTNYR